MALHAARPQHARRVAREAAVADVRPVGLHWLGWRARTYEYGTAPDSSPWFGVACPHCTNLDTLAAHCTNRACGWLSCTCGALVYSRRRHRHPLHGSDVDTCHAPAAAA